MSGFLNDELSKKTSIFGLRLWVVLGICVGVGIVIVVFLISLYFTSKRNNCCKRTKTLPQKPTIPNISKEIQEIRVDPDRTHTQETYNNSQQWPQTAATSPGSKPIRKRPTVDCRFNRSSTKMVFLRNKIPLRKKRPSSSFVSPLSHPSKIPKPTPAATGNVQNNVGDQINTTPNDSAPPPSSPPPKPLNLVDKMVSILADAGCTLITTSGLPCLPADLHKLKHRLQGLFSSDSSLRSQFLSGFSDPGQNPLPVGNLNAYQKIQIEIGKGHRISYPESAGGGSSHGSGSGDQQAIISVQPEVSHLGWRHWYTLRELEIATNGFADENVIGEGGYGIVYYGVLVGSIWRRFISTNANSASSRKPALPYASMEFYYGVLVGSMEF